MTEEKEKEDKLIKLLGISNVKFVIKAMGFIFIIIEVKEP